MYEVRKRFEVSASHMLQLPYASKCSNLHGHNWIITVVCRSETLNPQGMVFDFGHIKNLVCDYLDHTDISDKIIIDGEVKNPTAENIALWISKRIGDSCVEVQVQESEGNVALWTK